MASALGDVDACRRIVYENVQDAARERLHYVELRFSPPSLIGILSRTFGPDSVKKELEFLLSHKEAIAALDLVNTDDPVVSDIDLDYELEVAAPRAGLSKEHVQRAQRNAVEIAFLTPQEKEGLIDAADADRR